jgi:hypothetical protein
VNVNLTKIVLDAVWDDVSTRAARKRSICGRCKHPYESHCACGAHCFHDGALVKHSGGDHEAGALCPCPGFVPATAAQA